MSAESRSAGTTDRIRSGIEAAAWIVGVALSSSYLAANVHARLSAQSDLDTFRTQVAASSEVDQRLWSESRRQAYRRTAATAVSQVEAVLTIARIGLEVPVRKGTGELVLNRSVGRVPGTAAPGGDGNVVLAAHRDGFFRRLGELQIGDRIEVHTLAGRQMYIVEETLIVDPDAAHLMQPTDRPTLTLVTCYPFYFVGPAPQRFVVRAVRNDSTDGGKD